MHPSSMGQMAGVHPSLVSSESGAICLFQDGASEMGVGKGRRQPESRLLTEVRLAGNRGQTNPANLSKQLLSENQNSPP